MRHVVRRSGAAFLLLGAFVVAFGVAGCGDSALPTVVQPTVPTITVMPTIDEMLSPKLMGSASAANTIIEYGSFWNTNSASFHLQITPQLKSLYVDTSKASVEFRNLFVGSETATAATLARCVGNARFFDAADTIFKSQGTWSSSSDPDTALERIMLAFGMSQSLEDQCVANSALQNGLGSAHQAALAATYLLPDGSTVVGIRGLPAVVVNGVLLDGTNPDTTPNAANSATLTNIQAFLK